MEAPVQNWTFGIGKRKENGIMAIVKITYKLHRTLPGQAPDIKYADFEELYAEDLVLETEEPKPVEERLTALTTLIRTNTLSAKAKLAAKKG